ncbi:MAG: M67 family metallopeptidase [Chloroflexota bacterium]
MSDASKPADPTPSHAPTVRSTDGEPASVGDRIVPPVAAWQDAAEEGFQRRAAVRYAPPPFLPASARVPHDVHEQMIAWCLAGRPNEACGILAGPLTAEEGGIPTRFLGLTNAAASPYRYLIAPEEQLRVMLDIDDADEVVWGIVHSHVSSPPEPSSTDVGLAHYPDALYLICSLAGPEPVVRAWSIRDGAVSEIVLEPM